MKKNSYKPQFCTSEFYLENQSIFQNWSLRFEHLHPTSQAILWTVGLCILRRKNDWYAGSMKVQGNDYVSQYPEINSALLSYFDPTDFSWPKKVSIDISVHQFLKFHKIKSVPLAAHRSLTQMSLGQYPIEVLDQIPSPNDLLILQSHGKRILSLNREIHRWPHFQHDGRDYLSFLLHDLIHADHFFHQATFLQGQMGFYRSILHLENDPDLIRLKSKKNFGQAFEYLISDMNAHPVHLAQTLNAILKENCSIPDESERIWLSWTNVWSNCFSPEFSALQKINTQLFSHKTALELESLYSHLGQSSALAQ